MLGSDKNGDIITAIEFGTSTTRVAIGVGGEESLEILSHAENPSDGAVVKGELADMDKALAILNKTTLEAEEAAGVDIAPNSVRIAVTGAHITSRGGSGTMIVDGENKVVTEEDIREVENNALKSVELSSDEKIIETFPETYILDGKRRCDNPVNQIAHRLEAKVLALIGNRNQTDSFLHPLRESGFESPKAFFSGLCSAIPTVSDDEHEKGVVFIDMGAGTTEYAFLCRPSVLLAGVVPVGCDHMANDLSIALNLPFSPICQDLVLQAHAETPDAFISLPGEYANRRVPKDTVSKVVEMRMRETFEIARSKFDAAGLLGRAGAGIVFTGGGSMLPKAPEILRSVFDMPVRVAGTGLPENISGATAGLDSPRYSTLLGVLIFGASTTSEASVLTKFDHGINSMLRKAWKNVTGAFKF